LPSRRFARRKTVTDLWGQCAVAIGSPTRIAIEMLTRETKSDSVIESLDENLQTIQSHCDQLSQELVHANAPRDRTETLQTVSVLVPVYNERWTIETLLSKVIAAPLSASNRDDLRLEVIVVDDCSADGSAAVVQDMQQRDDRIKLVRHEHNRGKGAAIRTAIEHMTGDVAIIQDADLEYDPDEYPRLLQPILDGHADAVFGSRFAGEERRVLRFWHSLINRTLTTLCNMVNDLNLTDMETCYKVIRTDILRQLCLRSNSFTLEPELTTRLAQWGARIYEVPISYRARDHHDGKKIKAIDGVKAIGAMLHARYIDNRFTSHTGMYVLRSIEKAQRYNRWIMQQIAPFLGDRVAEAGAGIGNMSRFLTSRDHVLLVDHDSIYTAWLEDKFENRSNVRVLRCDLTERGFQDRWRGDRLDTIFCSNVVEHLEPDRQILEGFHDALTDGGHCIIIVPAGPKLYNRLDKALGHYRRYRREDLEGLMKQAGFEIAHSQQVCKVGAVAWLLNGNLLRRSHISPRQMKSFDRLWPLMRQFDRILPWKGMSLIVVGRKVSPENTGDA